MNEGAPRPVPQDVVDGYRSPVIASAEDDHITPIAPEIQNVGDKQIGEMPVALAPEARGFIGDIPEHGDNQASVVQIDTSPKPPVVILPNFSALGQKAEKLPLPFTPAMLLYSYPGLKKAA